MVTTLADTETQGFTTLRNALAEAASRWEGARPSPSPRASRARSDLDGGLVIGSNVTIEGPGVVADGLGRRAIVEFQRVHRGTRSDREPLRADDRQRIHVRQRRRRPQRRHADADRRHDHWQLGDRRRRDRQLRHGDARRMPPSPATRRPTAAASVNNGVATLIDVTLPATRRPSAAASATTPR